MNSFSRYLNKVFDFRSAAATVTDARVEPDIPPSAVFLAAFHGFVFRWHSFQQLEAEISHPPPSKIGSVRRAPSATMCFAIACVGFRWLLWNVYW